MDADAALLGPAWLTQSLDWILANPVKATLLLALASALEGLFIVGLIIPGALLMMAAGAITVAGEISFWPVVLVAGLGAWLGDCLSFYIGWRYRGHLPELARKLRMPGAMARAERFFSRHGGKGVVLGRFIGPIRPLMPAIAGASGMRPLHFTLIDLIAALLWAPAYALPGVLVGATLSLAAEITTRLAMLVGLALLMAWLIWWCSAHAVRLLQKYAEPWLLRTMDWSNRHRRLGNLGPALADPDQPETPVLLVVLGLLASLSLLIGHLWWQWPASLTPPAIDEAVYDWLAAASSTGVTPLVWTLQALGSATLSAILGVSVLALFALLRQTRAAAHWIAGLAGGALLGLCLPGQGLAIGPQAMLTASASTHLSLCLWMTLGGLVTTRKPPAARITVYVVIGTLLGVMLLARLMLGQISFSQSIIAVAGALLWSGLLTLGYRRHLDATPRLSLSAVSTVIALLLVGALSLGQVDPGPRQAIVWEQSGRSPSRINLLWQGQIDAIQRSLEAAGWTALPSHDLDDYLRWLIPRLDDAERPPAPQWLAGERPALRFVLTGADQRRLILRLWRGHDELWLGQIGELKTRHWAGLMHVPLTRRTDAAMQQLLEQLDDAWQLARSVRETPLYRITPGATGKPEAEKP